MADVVFEDPIHHISGKLSRKYRTCYKSGAGLENPEAPDRYAHPENRHQMPG